MEILITFSRGNHPSEILGIWKLLLQFAPSSEKVQAGGIDDLIWNVVCIHKAILGYEQGAS